MLLIPWCSLKKSISVFILFFKSFSLHYIGSLAKYADEFTLNYYGISVQNNGLSSMSHNGYAAWFLRRNRPKSPLPADHVLRSYQSHWWSWVWSPKATADHDLPHIRSRLVFSFICQFAQSCKVWFVRQFWLHTFYY